MTLGKVSRINRVYFPRQDYRPGVLVTAYGITPESTDISAALNALASEYKGRKLIFPRGRYTIDEGNIHLLFVTMEGERGVDIEYIGTHGTSAAGDDAATFLLTGTTNVPFHLGRNVEIKNIQFSHPNQTLSTPFVQYPAIFTKSALEPEWARWRMSECTFVNPWIIAETDVNGKAGDWSIHHNRLFALHRGFVLKHGFADVLEFSNNFWSFGFWQAGATQDIVDQSNEQAVVFEVDIAASAYTTLDGILWSDNFVYGAYCGIDVVSGKLTLTQINGGLFDATLRMLRAVGGGQVAHVDIIGTSIYSQKRGDLSYTDGGFSCIELDDNGSPPAFSTPMSIQGVRFFRGSQQYVKIVGQPISHLNIIGGYMRRWGDTTNVYGSPVDLAAVEVNAPAVKVNMLGVVMDHGASAPTDSRNRIGLKATALAAGRISNCSLAGSFTTLSGAASGSVTVADNI